MKTVVIYHRADFDGIFCREIAKKFLPDAELIGWDYGDPEPQASKNLSTVGHEVFHLTHRILEWAGVKHDAENHEAGALLCGYLMKLVMEAIEPKKKRKK